MGDIIQHQAGQYKHANVASKRRLVLDIIVQARSFFPSVSSTCRHCGAIKIMQRAERVTQYHQLTKCKKIVLLGGSFQNLHPVNHLPGVLYPLENVQFMSPTVPTQLIGPLGLICHFAPLPVFKSSSLQYCTRESCPLILQCASHAYTLWIASWAGLFHLNLPILFG